MLPDRFQQLERPQARDEARIDRQLERQLHVALRPQVVHFGGLHSVEDLDQVGTFTKIAVVYRHSRVEGQRMRTAGDHSVDLVTFDEQEFGQVRPILPPHPGHQRRWLLLIQLAFS